MKVRELFLEQLGKSSFVTSYYNSPLELFISVLAADGENNNGLQKKKKKLNCHIFQVLASVAAYLEKNRLVFWEHFVSRK